ncbi:MAG: hypothetical protein H8D96_17200 [Desulfobacterales bacterium]|uniref:S-layer family protein n=1 Tax=Candidatus Desulfatibia vada TaxID=2841696 RepID=A0A8J6NW09_9BACT|nr:hypothetical protein [Candidatus Desulfatibia vada]
MRSRVRELRQAETEEGNLQVANDSALGISTVNGLSGLTITDTLGDDGGNNIQVSADGTVTITQALSNNDAGNVTLDANGANADVVVKAEVTAPNGFTSTGDEFDNTGGIINTSGGAGAITITHTGAVTIGAALKAGAGNVAIDTTSTIGLNAVITTTTGDVDIDATGLTTVADGGNITTTGTTNGNVTFGAAKTGALTTSGNVTTAGGTITFTNATQLGDSLTLSTGSSAAGNIAFSSTLNGTTDLIETLNMTAGTGSITFSGAVGNTKKLGAITINSASLGVTANSTIDAKSVSITDGGAVEIKDDVTAPSGFNSTGNGAFTMTDGALIDAVSQLIDISAGGDITLGGLKTTSESPLAVQIVSTGGSILDGGDNPALDVDAVNGTLTMTAATGSIGISGDPGDLTDGDPLEIKVAKLSAEGTSIGIKETDDLLLGVVDAGAGAVKLIAGEDIDEGSIKGGDVTIGATTIGLTTPVNVDVGPTNLFMTLSDQNTAGLSGYLRPAGALNSIPDAGNIVAPGVVIIEGIYTFLAGELAGLEGALAALATISNQQEALEALLRLAAEANFFMIPPLDLFIDMEEEDEFLDGAWLLNPDDLNVMHEIGRPTLLHSNSSPGTSPQVSLIPNGNQEQDLRILASL